MDNPPDTTGVPPATTGNVPPAPPDAYPAAGPPPGTGRPAPVSVLAGIGIVFGALFTLCKPAGLVFQLMIKLPQPNPVLDLLRDDPTMRAIAVVTTATGTLTSLLLLMSSMGSLALRPWGRMGMLAYACLALVMTFITQALQYTLIGPEVQRALRQAGVPPQPGMAWTSGWAGVAVGLLFGLWYPTLILVFFNRANVKAAFERGLGGTGI